jgi:hypothetical protein
MYTLSEVEFQREAKPILGRIFDGYDSSGYINELFLPTITNRRILYPCYGSFDESISVKTLVDAATAVGDEGCYITNIWKCENAPNHCFIHLFELLIGYSENTGTDEEAIGYKLGMSIYESESIVYSAQGQWAIRMNHEGYGLLGGSPEFMAVIESGVPNLNEQVYNFFERYRDWSMKPNLSWIPRLLHHAYGPERAEALIAASNLDMEYNPYLS